MSEYEKLRDIPQEILEYIGQIDQIEYPRQGCTSTVALVETARGKFAIKKALGAQYSQWLEREHQVLQVIGETGIPVAKAHLFLKTEDQGEVATWLVIDYIPGKSLRSRFRELTNMDTKLELLTQFGQILRQIHDLPVPEDLIFSQKRWVDRKVEEAEFNLLNFPVDGDEELLKRLQLEKPAAVPEKLIHGDYTLDNVMVHDNQVVAVIDWPDGALGDPRYDLALATQPKREGFHLPEELEAFYAGYGGEPITKEEYEYFVDLYEFF